MACDFPALHARFTPGYRLISVLMYSQTETGAVMLILLVCCVYVDVDATIYVSAKHDSETGESTRD